MKYEFRASGRLLLPFFGMALVMSGLLRLALIVAPLIWEPLGEVLQGLAALAGVVVVIALVLFTFAWVVVRFYQSMVAGEAYLSFTLPVKPGTHLLARLVVGTLYALAGILLAVLAGLIIIPNLFTFLTSGSIPVSVGSSTFMLPLSDIPGSLVWSLVGMMAVAAVVGTVCNLLYAQVSIAIAPVFTKHRVIGSIAAYLVLNTVESVLLVPALLPFILKIGPTNEDLANYLTRWTTGDLFTSMGNLMGVVWAFVGITLAVNVIFAVVHYFLTRWCLSKKLNLE